MTAEQIRAALVALEDMLERAARPTAFVSGYDLLLRDWSAAFLPLIEHFTESAA